MADIMLQAAKFHARFAPYIYSNARRFAQDCYPWTMTPLPIAFPHDLMAYGRENATSRAYEWLIGDALLATLLYGNDYEAAATRDVYLPRGRWMDFDTGKMYNGEQLLRSYALPVGKTPLFVGGSGVTLESVADKIRVCIYPVATNSDTTFTLPTSDRKITVRVRGQASRREWTSIRVIDDRGSMIRVVKEGRAFSFIPEMQTSYTVRLLH